MEQKLKVIAVFFLAVTPILLMLALAVRFGRGSRVLNCIDANRVTDLPRANAWAGNRMLILPAYSALAGVAGLQNGIFAIITLPLALVVGFAVMAWVMLGVQRFHRPTPQLASRSPADA
jgi:hypothetical protein